MLPERQNGCRRMLPTPCTVSAPTTSGEINPVILQTKLVIPIRTPAYFGANSTTFVPGPDAVKFDTVVAMVIIATAEVVEVAYTIATIKIAPIPLPG